MVIDSFKGKYAFLSNFYPCIIRYEGLTFPSVEHAYQAAKATNLVMRANFMFGTAGEAKKLGRKIVLREDWEEVKLDLMYELLFRKFHHTSLMQKLLDTEDSQLIEGNAWGDTFWGVCNGEGQNHLGRLLMELREALS